MNILKTSLLAAASVVALAGVAQAADPIGPVPVSPIIPSVTADNWTGFYAGVNAGYGWGEGYDAAGGVPADNVNGLLGGVQIGANFQQDIFVFGLEADIQASGLSQTVAPVTIGVDYFGTVRVRAGVDLDGVLPYLTAGLAYGQGRLEGPLGTDTQLHGGWTVGGGVEFKLDPQVSFKGEYLYTDLGRKDYYGGAANAGVRFHTIRAGVNFHF